MHRYLFGALERQLLTSHNARRFVRKRRQVEVPGLSARSEPQGSILDDACTFSDVHSVLTNNVSKLPYPTKELQQHLEKTSKELLAEKNKKKFAAKKKTNEIFFDHIPIEEQIVLLFPGQGAQFVGMGRKLIDCPQSQEIFERASAQLGYDIYKICAEGPSTKLEQTLYCQPAIFVCSVAAFEKLRQFEKTTVTSGGDFDDKISHVAGFSVGEFAALYAAGMLNFEDALRIVDVRSKAMHRCNSLTHAGMLTIMVNASSKLDQAMADAVTAVRATGEIAVCSIANFLYCGVRVVGGSDLCLRYLEENYAKYNIKVMKRLPVSGAFHTALMEDAIEDVRGAIESSQLLAPKSNVYSNYLGQLFPAKNMEIREAIVQQTAAPVKWEQIMQLIYRKHQDYRFPRFIEVGPGKQLGAMLLKTSKKAYATYEHFSC